MSTLAPSRGKKSAINPRVHPKHPVVKRTVAEHSLTVQKDTVAVLIPAHNEEQDIADTIRSINDMIRTPDEIIVISDNSTDKTVEIARSMGVTVIETAGNAFKKAGALNAGFRHLVADGTIPEFVVTMDADTMFDRSFLANGLHAMGANPRIGVMSAVCRGKNGLVPLPSWPPRKASHLTRPHGPIKNLFRYLALLLAAIFNKMMVWFQASEYARAGMLRIRYDIHSMSGAGSIIRAEALLDLLSEHRKEGQYIPTLYEERPDNLVEDFVLTLDIRKLGWICTNSFHTVAYTDLMRTLPALLRQRTRWVRGTVDELRRRKFSREARVSSWTLIYVLVTMPLYYLWPALIVVGVVEGRVTWSGTWFLALMGIYQALMTRKMGWVSMLISFTLVPDFFYGIVRHYWVITSVIRSFRNNKQGWE